MGSWLSTSAKPEQIAQAAEKVKQLVESSEIAIFSKVRSSPASVSPHHAADTSGEGLECRATALTASQPRAF